MPTIHAGTNNDQQVFIAPHLMPILSAITLSPRSHVAFADNKNVSFTCEADDYLFTTWILNGTYYNALPSTVLDDIHINRMNVGMLRRTVLKIPAKSEYNGTQLQCSIIGSNNEEMISQNASLTLQGKK